MKKFNSILAGCLVASFTYGQVIKPVQVYNVSGQLQWPPNFFMTNVFAAGGTTLSFDSLGRMTISSASGSGTNNLIQTNGVDVATIGTLNFTTGFTGYVSAGIVYIGNSVAGGGDVTTAQLLVVSNQTIVASNYLFSSIATASNKFQTDVTNLQGATNELHTRVGNLEGATNGLAAQILAVTNQFRTDITSQSNYTAAVSNLIFAVTNTFRGDVTSLSNYIQAVSNKFNTDVVNLQGATNSFNSTNANLATHINNVATNTIKWLTNIWGDVARGFGGLANNQVLTYDSVSGTWTNKTPTGGGTPAGNAGAIQFNQSGAFEGTNEFRFDRTNNFVRLVGSAAKYAVEWSGLGTNWMTAIGMTATNRANQALQIGVDNLGVVNGIAITSNNVSPYSSLHTNHTDLGAYILPWRTNYVEWLQAKQGISLGTNGNSFTAIMAPNFLWMPTNIFILTVTNPTAGQVLKINSVSYNGPIAAILITNDVDNSGGGGGGSLQTNENQFGANTVLNIKSGALVTNLFVYDFLTLSNSGTPSTPLTNHLKIGKDSYAGRGMLESWDDNGLSIAYQPAFMNNRIMMLMPNVGSTLGTFGVTMTSLGGVAIAHPVPTEEWPYTTQLATPAVSNASSGIFTASDVTTMGTKYGHNGYFFSTEFLSTNRLMQSRLTAPAGNRLFIGRTSTANPNLTNIVNTTNGTGQYAGLYLDSGWTNEFFLTVRDGTAEFRTNTGMLFVATNLYQFYMMQAPTSKMLSWKIKNLTSNTVAQGWFSNNVPTNMMKFGYLVRNGTTVVNSVRFSKIYVEAPLSP